MERAFDETSVYLMIRSADEDVVYRPSRQAHHDELMNVFRQLQKKIPNLATQASSAISDIL